MIFIIIILRTLRRIFCETHFIKKVNKKAIKSEEKLWLSQLSEKMADLREKYSIFLIYRQLLFLIAVIFDTCHYLKDVIFDSYQNNDTNLT